MVVMRVGPEGLAREIVSVSLFFRSCLLDFMFQGILSYVVLEKDAQRGNLKYYYT